ncbi:hypothetical protein CC78DRAFT_581277 [Lojkania enalia]|uniref:Uncharacterized protein n=1 Tax=Lojkania enalia TaxID=147567 RepID=A0A9P4N5N6_9PLEO|nr:hypothetical protein CC78DRAFT_581277 [Didymosphaeria enalia]
MPSFLPPGLTACQLGFRMESSGPKSCTQAASQPRRQTRGFNNLQAGSYDLFMPGHPQQQPCIRRKGLCEILATSKLISMADRVNVLEQLEREGGGLAWCRKPSSDRLSTGPRENNLSPSSTVHLLPPPLLLSRSSSSLFSPSKRSQQWPPKRSPHTSSPQHKLVTAILNSPHVIMARRNPTWHWACRESSTSETRPLATSSVLGVVQCLGMPPGCLAAMGLLQAADNQRAVVRGDKVLSNLRRL